MKKRVITAAVLLAVLIPVFIIPVLFPAFVFVMILFTMIGAFEMLRMFKEKEDMPKYFVFISILLTVLFYFGIVFSSDLELLSKVNEYFYKIDLNAVIFLTGFLLLTTIVFMPKYNASIITNSFTTIFYIGLSFASITILRMIGVRFLIYLFLITIMTDMFAYFIGVKFGKRKLAPTTSPNKSIEGAIAGSIAGTIIASLFAIFFDIYPETLNPDGLQTIFTGVNKIGELSRGLQALIIVPLTFVGTIISQLGDLVASKFKRNYEIEDFGNIFPGHGGVVDRFDSAMLSSIFIVLFITLMKVLFPL